MKVKKRLKQVKEAISKIEEGLDRKVERYEEMIGKAKEAGSQEDMQFYFLLANNALLMTNGLNARMARQFAIQDKIETRRLILSIMSEERAEEYMNSQYKY